MSKDITSIAKAVQEGLSLWKTFIATRQQAYERKMDKRKIRAVEYGERFILCYYSDEDAKEKKLDRYRRLFFKYNN